MGFYIKSNFKESKSNDKICSIINSDLNKNYFLSFSKNSNDCWAKKWNCFVEQNFLESFMEEDRKEIDVYGEKIDVYQPKNMWEDSNKIEAYITNCNNAIYRRSNAIYKALESHKKHL